VFLVSLFFIRSVCLFFLLFASFSMLGSPVFVGPPPPVATHTPRRFDPCLFPLSDHPPPSSSLRCACLNFRRHTRRPDTFGWLYRFVFASRATPWLSVVLFSRALSCVLFPGGHDNENLGICPPPFLFSTLSHFSCPFSALFDPPSFFEI